MIVKKTADELLAQMTAYLKDNTQINYFGEGSITKSILSTISNSLGLFYEDLDFNMRMAFISTSSGKFLDLIGQLLDCQRLANEGDENYRYRIIHQIYTIPGSNETALRINCRQVDNVRDVSLRPHVKGAGSFVIHVDVIDRNRLLETIQDVRDVVSRFKAFGIDGEVILPRYVKLHMQIRVSFKKSMAIPERQSIASNAKQAVRNYIDNLSIGEDFSANRIIFHVLNISEDIQGIDVFRFGINERPATFAGRKANWNEQFVPGEIEVIT